MFFQGGSIFDMIQYNRVQYCTASSGEEGSCMSRRECSRFNGSASGNCARNWGICCVSTFAISLSVLFHEAVNCHNWLMNEYGALVKWYSERKNEVLGEKIPVPASHCMPHIVHGLTDVPRTWHLMVWHKRGMVKCMLTRVCVCVCDTTKVILTFRFVLKQLLVKFIYSFQHPWYVHWCSATNWYVI